MNAKTSPNMKDDGFVAHLSSFLKSNAFGISQEEIINKCPETFGKNSEIEGTILPENFHILEKNFPIKVHPITGVYFNFTIPQESAFFLVAWNGDTNQMCWVQFAGQDDRNVYLKNPRVLDRNDKLDSTVFWSWPKIGFMLECSIRRSCL
ncbi:MAG TPA: hypothetical protein VMD27_04305 [Candidatus Aquilonibacter sp.]|nr:hypothetical protein [Candidatus Aquilonibacter sp.]